MLSIGDNIMVLMKNSLRGVFSCRKKRNLYIWDICFKISAFIFLFFPFMNLHPLVVHFPIALLSFYTFLEFLTLFPFAKKWNLKTTKILLLIWGLLWASLALQTGELAAEILNSKYLEDMIEWHEFFAELTIKPYVVLVVMYLLREIGDHQRYKKYWNPWSKYMDIALKRIQKLESWKVFVILAVMGFILLSITGAIGGGLVYGPDADPLTRVMFEMLR